MPFLDRDGVRVHYEAEGRGPAILLTHGYSATLRMWERQVEELADRFRVIRWDIRGHGDSDSPDDTEAYSHEATLGDMTALLDACGAERAILGGHSLGGYLSLLFHAAWRDRVKALMLFDTGPGFRKDDARDGWNRRAEGLARGFEEKGLAALGDSSEVRLARHGSPIGLAHAARGILTQRDASVIESLAAIEVPTLLVVGAKDKPFLAPMEYMAARIRGSTYAVIEGAGHAPNVEKPLEFNRVVRAFLEALPADASSGASVPSPGHH